MKTRDGFKPKIGMMVYVPTLHIRPIRAVITSVHDEHITICKDSINPVANIKSHDGVVNVFGDLRECYITRMEELIGLDNDYWDNHPMKIPHDVVVETNVTCEISVTKPASVTQKKRVCEICGDEFEGREGAKYCSAKCRKKASRLSA